MPRCVLVQLADVGTRIRTSYFAEGTGYVLITNNRRTMPDHIRTHYDAGHRLPGLFLLNRQARIGQVIEQLYLLWIASEAEEYLPSRHLPSADSRNV